jgi:4-hydroxybenzoate polyprenyltransferase
MSPDEPNAKPKHHSFQLTPERELPMRYRVARAAIIIYFVTFLASGFVMCACPSFFVVMAACAVVSIIYGSRFQRLLSAGLLVVAIAGFVVQLRAEQRMAERVRHIQETLKQRNQNQ